MSKKCRAYSASKLGLAPADNRKAFYVGWDAALAALGSGNLALVPVEPTDGMVAAAHAAGTVGYRDAIRAAVAASPIKSI